jgi:membrane fusion protein (multidrug efflux system)
MPTKIRQRDRQNPDAPPAGEQEERPRQNEDHGNGADDSRPVEKSQKEQGEKEQQGRDGEKKDQGPPKPPLYRRPIFWIVLIIVLVAGIAVGIPLLLYERSHESTDDAFIDGNIVQVSPQVAGHVVARFVDDNQSITAGTLIVEIDPRDYQKSLDEAVTSEQITEEQALQYQSEVQVAKAQEASARANVASAEANAEKAQQDLERYRKADPQAVSRQQLDNAIAEEKTTAAALAAARAQLAAASAQVNQAWAQVATANAQVRHAQTEVANAQLQLSYTKVYAPIAGRVTNRHVEVGDYVETGTALLALVPRDVWVTANFKETQLQYMQPGQPVKITVDAYSHKTFEGHVDSIQAGSGAAFSLLPPENATGNYVKVVQRVPVKIRFNQIPQELMAPGMSVIPTVKVR